MTLENFKLKMIVGDNVLDWKFYATVDEVKTTGIFRKKTIKTTRDIYKKYGGSWCFVDTGEFTIGNTVERMVRSFEAKNGKDLEHCNISVD